MASVVVGRYETQEDAKRVAMQLAQQGAPGVQVALGPDDAFYVQHEMQQQAEPTQGAPPGMHMHVARTMTPEEKAQFELKQRQIQDRRDAMAAAGIKDRRSSAGMDVEGK